VTNGHGPTVTANQYPAPYTASAALRDLHPDGIAALGSALNRETGVYPFLC
jgi:hypothetical protein